MSLFTPLPAPYPELQKYVRFAERGVQTPINVESIGERVYSELINKTSAEMRRVRRSLVRRIPYAMWLEPQRDIHENRAAVNFYYGLVELEWQKPSSRSRRLVTPLLHTYVSKFNLSSASFDRLADALNQLSKRCDEVGLSLLGLAQLHQQYEFFVPRRVIQNIASGIITHPNLHSIAVWFDALGLWGNLEVSALGHAAFREALDLPTDMYREVYAIENLILWSNTKGVADDSKVRLVVVNTLTKPWLERDPMDPVKQKICDGAIRLLKDPRTHYRNWNDIPHSRDLILKWLTGRTLEVFFKILEETADDIWRYRKEFWIRYYRQGVISEAWVALGPDAHRFVKDNNHFADLKFGKVVGAGDNQSALLMKMGDLIFCEWSHDGKLRVVEDHVAAAPALYEPFYTAQELRFTSLPFDTGSGNEQQGLTHASSATHWWQNQTDRFIRNRLGVSP